LIFSIIVCKVSSRNLEKRRRRGGRGEERTSGEKEGEGGRRRGP
jgi:hypothetical protein